MWPAILFLFVRSRFILEETTLTIAANDNWPLFLDRPQCAAMCGLSLSTFDSWVRKSILPKPLAGTRRWSRTEIEQAARRDIKKTISSDSPFEQWKNSHAH
jgi:predicted DNA-binding transcriptional regulator AlpA